MKSMITTILGVAALFTTAAYGGGQATQATTTGELKDAKQRVATRALGEKGYPNQLLLLERARLGSLIDDLESGRSVDPREVDQALERANELAH
jgi:hypothetical protein